jgi:hypothetical protein
MTYAQYCEARAEIANDHVRGLTLRWEALERLAMLHIQYHISLTLRGH